MNENQLRQAVVHCLQQHRYEEARHHLRTLAHPQQADWRVWHMLASAAGELGAYEEAEQAARQALARSDQAGVCWAILGNALQQQHRFDEALAAFEQAVSRQPDSAFVHYNRAKLLWDMEQVEAAIDAYLYTLELQPDCVEAHVNLALICKEIDNIDKALEHSQRALALDPDQPQAHSNLACIYMSLGQMPLALQHGQLAVDHDPDNALTGSNLLFYLAHSEQDPQALTQAHDAWAQRICRSIQPLPMIHHAPHQRLRVGYVSGDFRHHAVAWFFRQLMQHHNRVSFEWYGYAQVSKPDAVTEGIAQDMDHWCFIQDMDDDALAARIRADEIDVLVDLSGHTAGNRLPVFARKPAPVQVSFMGYPATTGLQQIDAYLSDPWVDPPEYQAHYRERLVHLDAPFFCFSAPVAAPDPGPLPALQNGHLTFGSFNKRGKLSDACLQLWGQVLCAFPDARLELVLGSLACAEVVEDLYQKLAAAGVARQRIKLHGFLDYADYLALHQRLDLVLDSMPWQGHTTTCHSLWMGVPCVVVAGKRHAARMGVSIMHWLDMEDWIADKEEDYLPCHQRHLSDLKALNALRQQLRGRMQTSPLCDGPRFAAAVEQAYRQLWQERTA